MESHKSNNNNIYLKQSSTLLRKETLSVIFDFAFVFLPRQKFWQFFLTYIVQENNGFRSGLSEDSHKSL